MCVSSVPPLHCQMPRLDYVAPIHIITSPDGPPGMPVIVRDFLVIVRNYQQVGGRNDTPIVPVQHRINGISLTFEVQFLALLPDLFGGMTLGYSIRYVNQGKPYQLTGYISDNIVVRLFAQQVTHRSGSCHGSQSIEGQALLRDMFPRVLDQTTWENNLCSWNKILDTSCWDNMVRNIAARTGGIAD